MGSFWMFQKTVRFLSVQEYRQTVGRKQDLYVIGSQWETFFSFRVLALVCFRVPKLKTLNRQRSQPAGPCPNNGVHVVAYLPPASLVVLSESFVVSRLPSGTEQ